MSLAFFGSNTEKRQRINEAAEKPLRDRLFFVPIGGVSSIIRMKAIP